VSNQKLKVENYSNFGGINSKFSPHLTTPMEFMDIKNYDFQTPGSLTQRWGATQYMGQTLAGKITALSEYQRLNGTSVVICGSSGGLWYGATTGNFQGMSFTNQGSTIHFGYSLMGFNPVGYFRALGWGNVGGGISFNEFNSGVFYQGSSLQYIMGIQNGLAGYTYDVAPQLQSGSYASIEYLVDRCFIADGSKFVKFDGVTTTNVGLPIPIPASLMYGYDTGSTPSIMGFGGTGAAIFYVSYVNDRGFESNIMPVCSAFGPQSGPSFLPTTKTGTIAMTLMLNTPYGYGISSINVYSYCVQSVYSTLNIINIWNEDVATWNYPFVKINSVNASGSTLTAVPIGTTVGGFASVFNNIGPLPNPYINQYQPMGLSLGPIVQTYYTSNDVAHNFDTKTIQGYCNPFQSNFYPQYLAVYDNRMFCAGFSALPSTVVFSDVKEPEGYLPSNNFEVRTNDSDYITSLKSYQTRLYIFKKNSFHVLVGDNPSNFFVQEISNIYGCLNNRCSVLFDDVMLFLDRKGVFQYNGANLVYVSPKVQPIFDRMNYNSALLCACGAHDKLRNQVLFAIPVDGSTTNNLTVVYDYVADSWTTHSGYNANLFAEIQGYNNTKRLFYGDYNGRVNWFSASFLSDNGSGITLSYKTRYLHDMGDSVQKQFRRLYVNADNLGATLSSKINFYQDYGTSIVLATTLNLGAFQERIDYGISGKSLAYEMISVNTSNSVLRIHGFTIESRLQRKV
jgi:hypothetical protein